MLYSVKLLDDCQFAKDLKESGCVLIEEICLEGLR